jgi:hypothetical protein
MLSEFEPMLLLDSPVDKYVFYDLDHGWYVLNKFYFDKINLKLNFCKADKEIVQPVKDEILAHPVSISWWQKKEVVIGGVAVSFAVGALLGVFVSK